MGLFSLFSKDNKKDTTRPRTVQQSIPYTQVYDNGVIEIEPGTFTKAYRLEDINFKIAPDEEQARIFDNYGAFLNTFPEGSRFQIIIQNKAADRRQFANELRFDSYKDGLNGYRAEMNKILLDKVSVSKNNLAQDKMCIVSIKDEDVAHGMKVLSTLDKDVAKALRKFNPDSTVTPMTLTERLRSLHSIYCQDGTSIFENVRHKDGTTEFDLQKLFNSGLTSKEACAPSGMSFKPNHFTVGNTFGRTLFLEKTPTWLSTEFVADIAELPYSLVISMQYEPIEPAKALKMVRTQLINLNSQIAGAQKKAVEAGYSTEVISPELYRSHQQATSLMEDMVSRDQKLYYVTMTVTVFGDTLAQLDEATRQVAAISGRYNAPLKPLLYLQEYGLNSCLPLCVNQLHVKKLMTTESGSIFLPYTSQELYQKNGVYYGINQTTGSIITYSRKSGNNFNGLIFGESGSGKSFMAKAEMLQTLLREPDAQIYIIDPEKEYTPMVQALHGEVINLSSGSKSFVNPLDMDLEYDGEGDPLAMKCDYLVSMIELMYGRGWTMEPSAKSMIGRCVKNIYRPYLQHLDDISAPGHVATCDKAAMPTLASLYNELRMQQSEQAQALADVLEIYSTGTLTTFAHRSNIETNAKIVSYNIKNLGAGMKDLGLFVCLNDVWNKMIENHRKGIWTYVYIDEFYLLLRSESASAFLMEIWKRARKWNGVPTGIMQNTEDLLRSVDSRNIINNTSFIMMMSMPKFDRDNMADFLQISDAQLEYITNNERGTGLLYNGKTILPFNNEYPRESRLYDLMSTSQALDASIPE